MFSKREINNIIFLATVKACYNIAYCKALGCSVLTLF